MEQTRTMALLLARSIEAAAELRKLKADTLAALKGPGWVIAPTVYFHHWSEPAFTAGAAPDEPEARKRLRKALNSLIKDNLEQVFDDLIAEADAEVADIRKALTAELVQ